MATVAVELLVPEPRALTFDPPAAPPAVTDSVPAQAHS